MRPVPHEWRLATGSGWRSRPTYPSVVPCQSLSSRDRLTELSAVTFSGVRRPTPRNNLAYELGNAQINYNCNYGQLPQGFSVAPGTYKEVSGS